jgi:hypothetical protein
MKLYTSTLKPVTDLEFHRELDTGSLDGPSGDQRD